MLSVYWSYVSIGLTKTNVLYVIDSLFTPVMFFILAFWPFLGPVLFACLIVYELRQWTLIADTAKCAHTSYHNFHMV